MDTIDVLITITILGIVGILITALILASITDPVRVFWSIIGTVTMVVIIISLIISAKVTRIYGGLVGRATLNFSMAIAMFMAFGLWLGPIKQLFGESQVHIIIESLLELSPILFLLLAERTLLRGEKPKIGKHGTSDTSKKYIEWDTVDISIASVVFTVIVIIIVALTLVGLTILRIYQTVLGVLSIVLSVTVFIISVKVNKIYGGLVGRAALYLSMAVLTLVGLEVLVGIIKQFIWESVAYVAIGSVLQFLVALFFLLAARTFLRVVKFKKLL